MKKFLSLVLALVMAMSLVTISAGATEYKDLTDKSTISYSEAVSVLNGMGIISGYTDGSFKPSSTLTRGAAAKIIACMMLGSTTADSLGGTVTPFKDVPASNVFAGYIAYCASTGIVDGYADGTFRPTATLTGFQFLKMLETALGYDSSIEKFTGPTWSVNVAKVAITKGLTKGNDGFVGTAGCTREQACLYALNTLKAKTVFYSSKGTSISVNGTVITSGASSAADNTATFMATYQTNLKLNTLGDSMGRPANTWTWKSTKIGTFAQTPAVTFTAETKEADVKTALSAYSLPTTLVLTTNDQNGASGTANSNAKIAAATGNGTVVEVYADSSNVVTTVVVATPILAKVATVNATKKTITLAPAAGGTAFATVTDSDSLYSTLSTLDVDSYVMVTYAGASTSGSPITAAYVPTTVSGTVSAKNGATATVAGVAYKATATYGSTLSTDLAALGSTSYTMYLDQYGFVAFATATSSANTSYAYAIGYSKDGSAMNGYTYYLKLVDADGSVAWQKIGQYDGTAITKDSASSNLASNLGTASLTAGAIVSYSVLADGSYNVKLASAATIGSVTLTQNQTTTSATFKVSNTTTFLYQNSDDTFTAYVGIKNLPVKTTSSATVITNIGNTAAYAKLVVVKTGIKSTNAADVMYIMDQNFTGSIKDSYVDGTEVFSYDAIVNGTLKTVYCADNTSYAVGNFYSAVTYAKADYNQLTANGSAVTPVAVADTGVYYALNDDTSSIIIKDGLLKVTTATGGALAEYAMSDSFAVYYVDTKSTAATSDDALTDVILGSSNLFAGQNATTTGAFTTLVTTSEKDGGEATAVYILANMA